MRTRIRWTDAGHAFIAVTGPVDPSDVEVLGPAARRLSSSARLTVDLHDAVIEDVALVRLASELGVTYGDGGGPALVGLSSHHHRLLRYAGVAARHA